MKLIEKVKSWFKKESKIPENDGTLYDYTSQCWGHALSLGEPLEDNSFDIHGFSSRTIKNGDEVLYKMKKGIAVCRLWNVKNCNNPTDMFFAKLSIIRYATDEDNKRVNKTNEGLHFV